MIMKKTIIGLREFRENTETFIKQVAMGESFVVVRKSRPVFRISASDEADDLWERAIDFTKIKKGGVALKDLLAQL
jgi:prevent-host-death family protein